MILVACPSGLYTTFRSLPDGGIRATALKASLHFRSRTLFDVRIASSIMSSVISCLRRARFRFQCADSSNLTQHKGTGSIKVFRWRPHLPFSSPRQRATDLVILLNTKPLAKPTSIAQSYVLSRRQCMVSPRWSCPIRVSGVGRHSRLHRKIRVV